LLRGLVEAAFELPDGRAAGPFMSDVAAYVVQLRERIEPDPAGYDAQKELIKNRLLMERRQQVFEDFYENLRRKVEVKIDQDLFQAA
jgi:parvulin-like peptidyl-prolyl isomerase